MFEQLIESYEREAANSLFTYERGVDFFYATVCLGALAATERPSLELPMAAYGMIGVSGMLYCTYKANHPNTD